MAAHEIARDGEAEPGPAGVSVTAGFEAHEGLEHPLAVGIRNARAVVVDLDPDFRRRVRQARARGRRSAARCRSDCRSPVAARSRARSPSAAPGLRTPPARQDRADARAHVPEGRRQWRRFDRQDGVRERAPAQRHGRDGHAVVRSDVRQDRRRRERRSVEGRDEGFRRQNVVADEIRPDGRAGDRGRADFQRKKATASIKRKAM